MASERRPTGSCYYQSDCASLCLQEQTEMSRASAWQWRQRAVVLLLTTQLYAAHVMCATNNQIRISPRRPAVDVPSRHFPGLTI